MHNNRWKTRHIWFAFYYSLVDIIKLQTSPNMTCGLACTFSSFFLDSARSIHQYITASIILSYFLHTNTWTQTHSCFLPQYPKRTIPHSFRAHYLRGWDMYSEVSWEKSPRSTRPPCRQRIEDICNTVGVDIPQTTYQVSDNRLVYPDIIEVLQQMGSTHRRGNQDTTRNRYFVGSASLLYLHGFDLLI